MNAGILLKNVYSFLFHRQIRRKLASVPPEQCVVLTYHRIVPPREVTNAIEPGMYVTPVALRMHIRFLKKYFTVISVEQLEKSIVGQCSWKNGKPYCVLTFDDGWRDFYTYAWPVLQEENVPAMVYLPTALIGSGAGFWTDRLAAVLKQAGSGVLVQQLGDDISGSVLAGPASFEEQLTRAIELLKEYPYSQIEKILDVCEQDAGISGEKGKRVFMNWQEVREVFVTGLVSFGSHTVNHAILTTLERAEVDEELRDSKDKLLEEQVVKEGCISFCYPNGNYSEEIVRQAAAAGYSSAMSCDFGWNGIAKDSLMRVKRISLHQDISSSVYLLAYRLVQGL